jgi:two-component system phosphate regulon sensor histidine kinase PhoR
MPGARRDAIGRGAFFTFLGVVLLAAMQLAWWIYFLARIANDRRHVVMFASEGAFFMLALLAGVFLIYRTLVEQVRLRQMRATFLSAVTHELKSPLASLRLFLETLEAGRIGDEAKRADLVRKMLLDVDRLEHLVRDLLRAGQLESEALAISREPVDLSALAAEAAEAARRRLEARDSFDVRIAPGVVVAGDRALLRSVVENLLDNAVKYSKPPRAIALELAPGTGGGPAALRVRDNGAGIDAATLAHIFEPFHRSGDEDTRAVPGTGLGLFLVQGILRAHGGRCVVASDGPGRGTRVECLIPAAGGG